MRELTFKGYLQQQLCELSGLNSKSLYKFAKLSENNARLRDVLCLFLNYYVDEKLKNQLCRRFPNLLKGCELLHDVSLGHFDDLLSEYRTIYENYLNNKNSKENEEKIKFLMQKRIVEVQAEKGITNYRIYKALNLNPGNVNAFLKKGDTGKVGLDTARRILAYVNQ
jgi:hypothetical protein